MDSFKPVHGAPSNQGPGTLSGTPDASAPRTALVSAKVQTPEFVGPPELAPSYAAKLGTLLSQSDTALPAPMDPVSATSPRRFKAPDPSYTLAGPVGPGCVNHPSDVAWVRGRLYLQINPDTGQPFLDNPDPSNKSFDAELGSALAVFQTHFASVKDGKVDPRGPTAQALARAPSYHLDASVGVGGENHPLDVARVQQTLVQHGLLQTGRFTLGVLDPASKTDPTLMAIALFQQRFTQNSDGRIDVGGDTHRQLKHATPLVHLKNLSLDHAVGNVPAGAPQWPTDILAVQLRLVQHRALSWDDFTPGVINDATKAAIVTFQSRFMKKPDGRVDPSQRTDRMLALDRHEMDARFPRGDKAKGQAVDSRGDAIDLAAPTELETDPLPAVTAATKTPAIAPTDKTGFHLDVFPIKGDKFNIGYDKSWNNFDAPQHNSDYYRTSTSTHVEGHLGNDVFGPRGAEIVAPVSGTIVNIVKNDTGSGGGRCVTIRRGNEFFYLAHLDSVAPNLKVGQTVAAGTTLGTLGDSGSARDTAPHLHFSCYRGTYSNSSDPFPYLMEAVAK